MDNLIFVFEKALQVFQMDINLFGYTFSFYGVFWWSLVVSLLLWFVRMLFFGG